MKTLKTMESISQHEGHPFFIESTILIEKLRSERVVSFSHEDESVAIRLAPNGEVRIFGPKTEDEAILDSLDQLEEGLICLDIHGNVYIKSPETGNIKPMLLMPENIRKNTKEIRKKAESIFNSRK